MASFDATALHTHAGAIADAAAAMGGIDIARIAHGTLPDQAVCERDPAPMLQAFSSNATSVMSLLTLLASRMQAQGHGVLCVISSVAGERGRVSDAVYGAAKRAVSLFTQACGSTCTPAQRRAGADHQAGF